MEPEHRPVLQVEAIDALDIKKGSWIIDATFGRGGHTREILNRGGRVIAFDCDREAIAYAQRYFVKELEEKRVIVIRENFAKIAEEIDKLPSEIRENIGGALADVGVSSTQLDTAERGFSFTHDSDLDMRMDDRLGVTAKDLINGLGRNELTKLFIKFGDEHRASKIAEKIVQSRKIQPITSTKQLAELVSTVVARTGHLHPATKVFQALRIAINDELYSLQAFLSQVIDRLQKGSRIVVISFHEGEDRIVKHQFIDWEAQQKVRLLTKKPVVPTREEVEVNPRSRSGKLRACEVL